MKKSIPYIIIFVLLLVVAGEAVYIYLDKKDDNNIVDKTEKEEPKKDIEKIDEELINKLFNSLVVSDKSLGLYSDSKLSINDIDGVNLILFGVKSYLDDKKIDYMANAESPGNYYAGEVSKILYEFKKDDFNKYMSEKFHTNNTYDLPICTESKENFLDCKAGVYGLEGLIDLVSFKDEWVIAIVAREGETTKLSQKLVKYEIDDDDNIYIYTEIANCYWSAGYSVCFSDIADKDKLIECNDTSNCFFDENNYEEYIYDKFENKLQTYKHTFKKVNNDYYWYSTEIVNN